MVLSGVRGTGESAGLVGVGEQHVREGGKAMPLAPWQA